MYGKNGKYSSLIYSGLSGFGIKKRDITYVNYYKDSIETSKKKIADSTLLFFPGGLPDRLMDRLRERDLYDSVLNYQGEVIMGASAGAMIQLAEYHITPDSDYSEYSYCNGFPFIKDFDIEVHYEATRLQKECIARAIRDKGKPVYAVCNDGGIIIDNGIVTPFSKVRKYTKPPYVPKRKPKILE
ncbi:MAG: Type 1 glutamine amidotransferase-like domain-containing protein [Clostridia bacterium]